MLGRSNEMREFIGHKLMVRSTGLPSAVEGIMVEDRSNMIILKGSDGSLTRVVKSHIAGFAPTDFEPVDYVPFHMLFCENRKSGCRGVKYIREGAGVAVKDYEEFMAPCPCRSQGCTFGTKGELRTVEGKILRETIAGTMYGDYPEKKEAASGNSSGKSGAGKAGIGKSSGAATGKSR